MFVYFCRGLSGNKEERPTCRDNIEISTHRAIFYHLEDSRSHGKEVEPERGQAQGARPEDLGARPLWTPFRTLFAHDVPLTYWIQNNIVPPRLLTQKRIEGEDYIRRPPLALGGDKKLS